MSTRTTALALAIGSIGGVLSGLLGVGGGIVMVPGLVLVLGSTQRKAHGTSLAAIIPIGAVGAAVYGIDGGHIDVGFAGALALGAVVGAPIGVRALARIPERALRVAFIAVVFAAAGRLLV
jgi:uncharacterized membrane protein YfcA